MNINVYKVSPEARIPNYETRKAACFDLSALILPNDPVIFYVGKNKLEIQPVHGVTTNPVTVYGGVCTGVAIVNSVNLSNISSAGGVLATLDVVKGATAFSIITNAQVPSSTTLQALDAPIVLEANNFLRVAAGYTGYLHTFVSVMEVT